MPFIFYYTEGIPTVNTTKTNQPTQISRKSKKNYFAESIDNLLRGMWLNDEAISTLQ